jgi:hypothetical protein
MPEQVNVAVVSDCISAAASLNSMIESPGSTS